MAVVTFDVDAFREAYPKFSALTDGQLEQAFAVACLIINNTASSSIPYSPDSGVYVRRTLLWLMVCHLATMALWETGQSGPASSATEGSVSVSFSVPTNTGRDWYNLTPCGQTLWRALLPYVCGGRYYGCRSRHQFG